MLVRSLAFACVLAVASLTAHATPITYTLAGNFSGTLGNSSFTDTYGVFTLTANTASVQPIYPGFFTNTGGNVSFLLSGYAPITFPNTALGTESEYNTASFYDLQTGFGIGAYSDAIGTYDLTALIGPVDGTFVSTGPIPEHTSLGDLTLRGATGDMTFAATPQVTPEPSSLLLLGTGALGMAGMLRRRIAHS